MFSLFCLTAVCRCFLSAWLYDLRTLGGLPTSGGVAVANDKQWQLVAIRNLYD